MDKLGSTDSDGPFNPDELRSDRRGACQIVADRGPDLSGKQKNIGLANHHPQDVVVLQKAVKK